MSSLSRFLLLLLTLCWLNILAYSAVDWRDLNIKINVTALFKLVVFHF